MMLKESSQLPRYLQKFLIVANLNTFTLYSKYFISFSTVGCYGFNHISNSVELNEHDSDSLSTNGEEIHTVSSQ